LDPITLISPDGREYTVATEAQYHDLVEGRGYRPKTQSPQGHTTRAAKARSAAPAQQSSTAQSTEPSPQSSDQSAS
jgi:hypothetical protein